MLPDIYLDPFVSNSSKKIVQTKISDPVGFSKSYQLHVSYFEANFSVPGNMFVLLQDMVIQMMI